MPIIFRTHRRSRGLPGKGWDGFYRWPRNFPHDERRRRDCGNQPQRPKPDREPCRQEERATHERRRTARESFVGSMRRQWRWWRRKGTGRKNSTRYTSAMLIANAERRFASIAEIIVANRK